MSRLEKAFAVIDVLNGHEYSGLRLQQVATAAKLENSTALRLLQELEKLRIVQRDPHDPQLWRLGAKLVRMAVAYQTHMAQQQRQLEDFNRNYSLNQ